MKNQIRLPRKIALRFELIFLKLSSASDWIICTKECELIKSGHTFGLLAVSPLLFNLFINNLPYLFENTLSDPFVLPNGTKINSLLYADDLIILSRSKTGLQNCLNTLSSYCKTWRLKVNPKKTKIMIFQKRPRKSVDINFNIGTEPIEIVQEYTYLGTRLTPTGNYSCSRTLERKSPARLC